MLAGVFLVSAVPPPVRVTTLRQLLSLVPVLFGYYPRACVVVLGVAPPRGTVRVSQRCPGYDPGDPAGAARAAPAAPAALLAHAAWRAGNGALANVALDRALDNDPCYPLARTMRRVLARGTSPDKAEPPMTPRHAAAFYRARATGAPRSVLTARREAADGYLSA